MLQQNNSDPVDLGTKIVANPPEEAKEPETLESKEAKLFDLNNLKAGENKKELPGLGTGLEGW